MKKSKNVKKRKPCIRINHLAGRNYHVIAGTGQGNLKNVLSAIGITQDSLSFGTQSVLEKYYRGRVSKTYQKDETSTPDKIRKDDYACCFPELKRAGNPEGLTHFTVKVVISGNNSQWQLQVENNDISYCEGKLKKFQKQFEIADCRRPNNAELDLFVNLFR